MYYNWLAKVQSTKYNSQLSEGKIIFVIDERPVDDENTSKVVQLIFLLCVDESKNKSLATKFEQMISFCSTEENR